MGMSGKIDLGEGVTFTRRKNLVKKKKSHYGRFFSFIPNQPENRSADWVVIFMLPIGLKLVIKP